VTTPGIDPIPVSARSYDDYVASFRLSRADLAGRILDVAAGAAAFVAGVDARGGSALAADPAYLDPPSQLCHHVIVQAERDVAKTAAGPPSAREFAVHYVERPDCYVAAALPKLPFADGAFDLVVCSHFLFVYRDRLSERFHIAALRELGRVSRGEARVFPVTGASPDLPSIRRALADGGVDTIVEPETALLRLAGSHADLR
jgi:SAM-dependent methyltransferase